MKKIAWLGVLLVVCLPSLDVWGQWKKDSSELSHLCRRLKGKLIDHTANHGHDRRIWSRSLGEKRDLYVYLPPNYDPNCQYPIVMFLHGFAQDEQLFLQIVAKIDETMCKGQMPPAIIAAPDGSLTGEPNPNVPGSFFINSQAGDFENWVLQDVWDFVVHKYPIRHEREAHVLAGVSMGGFGAYNLGIRHRNAFGTVVALYPPLNLRWCDLEGNYFANFDPRSWGWRQKLDNRNEIVARFYGGLVKLRIGAFVDPLFGLGDEALEEIARQNPIELVDKTGLQNGELAMFVGYGGKDEFNIDAQVESFLYLAKCRGLSIGVAYEPEGRHDMVTAMRLWPSLMEWLAPRLAPFAPK